MMELDEAIRHAEEIAEQNEEDSKTWICDGWQTGFKNLTPEKEAEFYAERVKLADGCAKCAKEHRQLAEWLKELKELREKKIPGKWVKEWEDIPITGGIMHQPYWSCPRCGRKWEAYSAQFITFCSKCGMKLIDGDCKEGDENG